MKVYYNDNDPFAVKWLKELITDGLIPKGDVDGRSILDVKPSDLDGYVQCHFFAGVGGWPYALRLAGWPEDRPVFTGSCPCQPFSVAGKGKGLADERHLWPAFRWLIAQCRPATCFGEQVASKDGRLWLSGVRADLEAMGYRVGASDLCAAGIGAPHIRQRLWWVADNTQDGWGKRHEDERGGVSRTDAAQERIRLAECGGFGGLADSIESGLEGHTGNERDGKEPGRNNEDKAGSATQGSCVNWFDAIWWPCRDGKYRRVPARRMGDTGEWEIEPALFPLADGIPNRVGILRGAGNAIVPQVAAEFIGALIEIEKKRRLV